MPYKNPEKQREYQREWERTSRGKELRRRAVNKYFQSAKGKETLRKAHKRYSQSAKGKEALRKCYKKYQHTPNWKESHKKYLQSPKGKSYLKRHESRKRGYKHIPLMPNIFPMDVPVDDHHLLNDFYSVTKNEWFVIPLPKITHQFVNGYHSNKEHWRFNAEWIKKIYCIDVKELLSEK